MKRVRGFIPTRNDRYKEEFVNLKDHDSIRIQGKEFFIDNDFYHIKLTEDISNCGIMNISNFGNLKWSLKNIRSLAKEIISLIDDLDLQRNFIMGTINEYQKNLFAEQFLKEGWIISFLFNNDNSEQNCYLITKKL